MASNSIGNGSTSFNSDIYNQLSKGSYQYPESPRVGAASKRTDRTNRANLAIARETNASNYMLASAQNDWNIEQWNRENQYNSPLEQRKRLLEAGLNPNLMLDGGDAGNARSLDSANMSNAQGATMQSGVDEKIGFLNSVQSVMQSASDTAMLYDKQRAEIANLNSQTNAQNIQNTYLDAILKKSLEKLGHDTTGSKWNSKLSEETYANMWLQNNMMNTYGFRQARLQNNFVAQQISNLMTQQAFTNEQANMLQKQYQWFDQQALQEIYESCTRAQLNNSNAYLAMQNAFKANEETRGIKLDNDMKQKLFDDTYRVSSANLKNQLGYFGSNPYELGAGKRRAEYSKNYWDTYYQQYISRNSAFGTGFQGSGLSVGSTTDDVNNFLNVIGNAIGNIFK